MFRGKRTEPIDSIRWAKPGGGGQAAAPDPYGPGARQPGEHQGRQARLQPQGQGVARLQGRPTVSCPAAWPGVNGMLLRRRAPMVEGLPPGSAKPHMAFSRHVASGEGANRQWQTSCPPLSDPS